MMAVGGGDGQLTTAVCMFVCGFGIFFNVLKIQLLFLGKKYGARKENRIQN